MNRFQVLRQTSSNSVEIISIQRDELLRALKAIAERIRAEHPEVASIRLFGSVARGDQVGTSDVDVLIVLRDDSRGNPLERIRAFYPYFDLPIGVDLLVYSKDQVTRGLQAGDGFLTHMWRESQPLRESED